jgi:hypothetical protein
MLWLMFLLLLFLVTSQPAFLVFAFFLFVLGD